MARPVLVPQDNPNDDVVVLVEWTVADGAEVVPNQVVAVMESTKSTFEVEVQHHGYLRHLARPGDEVAVGDTLAMVTRTPDEPLPDAGDVAPLADHGTATDGGRSTQDASPAPTSTKKADILARRAGAAIATIAEWAGTSSVTEAHVEAYLSRSPEATLAPGTTAKPMADNSLKRIVIVGAGMGANQLLDAAARDPLLVPVGIVDDDAQRHGTSVYGVPVLGSIDALAELARGGAIDAVCLSIAGSMRARSAVLSRLDAIELPRCNIIDPSCVLSLGSSMGTGNFLSALSRVGPDARIGNDNYLSSYVSIEHHCTVGDNCTFGPGVLLSGQVTIGSGVRFGTGVFVEPSLHIGDGATIASGAVITKDVPAGAVVKVPSSAIVRPLR